MQSKYKTIVAGMLVILLFGLGVSQLQAQSTITLESLSARIATLGRRITALSNSKTDKSEVLALELRVAALEAEAGLETPRPSPTVTPSRLRPTSTPSPPHPNSPNRFAYGFSGVCNHHPQHEHSQRAEYQF